MLHDSKVLVGAYALLIGVLLGMAVARRGGRTTANSSVPGRTGADHHVGAGLGRSDQRSAGTSRTAGRNRTPSSPGALEPLTAKRLKKRVIDNFPAAYLMQMAIIQGVALVVLITTTSPLLASHPSPVHAGMILTQALATGLTLVIVTHEYLLLTMMTRWVPTTLDTLIPYLLGLGEIWMALATGHIVSWWAALSSMCIVAIFAFWHTRIRTTQDAFGGRTSDYQRNCQFIGLQIHLSAIMLVVSADAVLMNSYHTLPAPLNICLIWVAILMGLGLLALGEYNQNKQYDAYRLPRWRPWGTAR